jgi:hypothetical protein
MEGFYFKQSQPRVLLSSLRPVGRRAFTCAHEIGHHWFGHGSTIDQLQEDERAESDKPDEILANAFAAALLMPTVGLRGAFARRGWDQTNPTPVQLYTIACQFGVGYNTLLNHLCFTLREIGAGRRLELDRWTPQRIRRLLLQDDYRALVIVDAHNEAASFEVEKGSAVLLPLGVQIGGTALKQVSETDEYELYEAVKRGIAPVTGLSGVFEVRGGWPNSNSGISGISA